jgi:DNA-binding LytR/AlgR family response regulator
VPDTEPAPNPFDRAFWISTLRILLACLAIAAVIWLSGESHDLADIVIWCVEIVFGVAIGVVVARQFVPQAWFATRAWAAALVIAASVSGPMSALVIALHVFVGRQRFTLGLLEGVLPSVFGVSLVMTGLAFMVRRPMTQTHAAQPDAPPAKFLDRLPPRLRGAELFAVEAEDHYLRLHTSLGQDLILMRLADAVAELEGLEGAQTHRSWWVARGAVTSAERLDGRAVLTLRDGAEAPVSRGFARALRAAGWF